MRDRPVFASCLVLMLGLGLQAPVARGESPCRLRFAASFPEARSAQPLDGRLLVLISTDDAREPRFQISDGLDTQQAFGIDVEALAPAAEAIVDGGVLGYPRSSLADIEPGDYWVQGLLHRYETFHRADGHVVKLPMDRGEGQQWNRAPGNLYSTPVRVRIDPASDQVIRIVLDQEIAPIAPPKDTRYIKHVKIHSKLLTDFWGRPMELGACVLLPHGFDEHPEARFPLVINHGHFPYSFSGFRETPPDPDLEPVYSARFDIEGYNRIQQEQAHQLFREWTGPDFPRMVIIKVQHANPYYDDSYAVNSENLGPYGDAIMHELVPFIEQRFRCIGEGWARFTYGGSTGGWEALAVQVMYPEAFNGCFAACPDPIDFRAYTVVNIYEDENAYYAGDGWKRTPRSGRRDARGIVTTTLEQTNHRELVLGTRSRSGAQWDIWEAVYSPVGDDGYPQRIWDKRTGAIDPAVAAHWREHYDLRHILERDWATLGPKLEGKIHIYCGTMDNYYLNNAVVLMEAFLEGTRDPYYAGEVDYGHGAAHCWNGDQERPNGLSRLRYHQMYVERMLERMEVAAPAGADLTSWRYAEQPLREYDDHVAARKKKQAKDDLREYRRKRDFERTAEPRGGEVAAGASGRSFIVQKHEARQLHYDLRLELDGVLKSWAVPRGPCLDPKQKPLAVQTEDHPIEYGSFEGVIPRGEYGGGTVMLWDCGEWQPLGDPHEMLARGDLKFQLHGEKLRGAWVLARMKGDGADGGRNWLLIKKKDEAARGVDAFNVLSEQPFSVASGRTMEEIAAAPVAVWKDGRAQPLEAGAGGGATVALPDAGALRRARPQPPPARIRPQLATAVATAPASNEWLHEVKLDGYRLMCVVEDGVVRLLTRNGHDWTESFPAVARAVGRLPLTSVILDGEVVVLDAEGNPDFGALQSAFRGRGRGSFTYFAFDVPYALGYDLAAVPLIDRKTFLAALLEAAPMVAPTIQYARHIVGNGPFVFEQAREHGLEGIISKKANAPYVAKRSDTWLKVKCRLRQELVIGGYTEPGGARTGFGALLLGYYDGDGKLVYCGRVGSGFREQTLEMLEAELGRRLRKTPPFGNAEKDPDAAKAHWVRPDLVCEVEFTAWTNDDLLRHAVYLGLREDVDPRDVRREPTPKAPPASSAPAPAAAEPVRARGVIDAPASPEDAQVAGIRISNPNRTVYPEARVTKGEVARYYEAVAGWILPHVAKRPLSLVRCPLGLAGESFFQRHVGDGFPKSIRGTPSGAEIEGEPYLLVDDVRGLIALAQMGVLEIHAWGCREDDLEKPDRLVFDLDPGEGIEWEHIVASARFVRAYLDDLGLRSFVKTTGGKGVHVVVPIVRRSDWSQVRSFTHAVARDIAQAAPRNFVATMSKDFRRNRIYVDYLRNVRGATAVAAYSTRARPGACVSTPLEWEELSPDTPPTAYTVTTVPPRLADLARDPWEDLATLRQSITARMMRDVGV